MKTVFTPLKQLFLRTILFGLIPLGSFGATVISETFTTSPAANLTVVSGGTWAVSSGKYVLSAPASGAAGNGNIAVHNTNVTGDYTLTVDGSVTASSALWNDFSVIFGYQNSSNYYYFSSNESNDAGTSGLFKISAGTVTQLADTTTLITGGTTYAVKIVKTGSTYQAYRNNVLMATATDSTWSSGKIGFGTLNDGASYDNLLVNTTGGDTTPPTAPTGLIGVAISTSQINLSWNASTDNVGVTGYQVYRGGSLITTVAGTTHSDTGLTASTNYTYKVKAKDAANNLSADSNTITVTTLSSSGAPVEVASQGPNGTHWPSVIPTPFMYDTTVPNIVDVACSWSAISTAIAAVTPAQAAAGVLIRVAPGSLPGNGAGSTATPVLQNLGSSSWSKRVTVAPRDGYGTVTMSAGIRIFKVHGVCFAGFIGTGWQHHACNRSAVAWTKLTAWLGSYGTAGETTTDVEFVEVVLPTYYVGTGDTADIYSGGGNISNYRLTGCYMAPRYRPPGPSHTDTLQFATGSGGGTYSNMQLRDSAFFASSNAAVQTGSMIGMSVTNCYVAAGATSLTRYPFPAGANTDSGEARKIFNGGNAASGYNATNSIFIGDSVYSLPAGSHLWSTVSNTKTDRVYPTDQQPITGSWTVDTTMGPTNPTMPPEPTDAYLNSIWL